MAIAHVLASGNLTANTQTNTSISVTLGSTTIGHLNVIDVAVKVDGNGIDPVIATPAGWTAISAEAFDSGTTSSIGVRSFYRFFQSGDPSSVTVSWTNQGNGAAVCSAYSGVNTTTPITGFQVEPKGTTDTSYSVTVSTSLAGWVRSGFANRSGHTFSAMADTSRGTAMNTSATSIAAQDTAADVAAGSYTKTATGSGSTSIGVEFAYGLNSAGAGGVAYSWSITDGITLTETLATSSLATTDTYTDGLGLTDTVSRNLVSGGTTPERVPDFTFILELAPTSTPTTAAPDYTDVTSYVVLTDEVTLSRGREDEGSTDAQPGRASWVMDNAGGTFTPNDTGSAFAPFQLRRPFRWSVTVDGVTYPLWQGFLDGSTVYRDGTQGRARLACSDRIARLGAYTLPRLLDKEIAADWGGGIQRVFPLRSLAGFLYPDGVTLYLFPGSTLTARNSNIVGGYVTVGGGNAPPLDGDACAEFRRASTTSGQFLRYQSNGGNTTPQEWTIEAMVNPSSSSVMAAVASADHDLSGNVTFPQILGIDANGRASFQNFGGTSYTLTGTTTIPAGVWTHLAVVGSTVGNSATLYVNGVAQATRSGAPGGMVNNDLLIGGVQDYTTYSTWAPFDGYIAYAGYYASALTAARLAAHASAMQGYTGEVASARFARLCAASGLPSAMYATPTPSTVPVGAQTTNGRQLLDAINEIAAMESGLAFADAFGTLTYQPAQSRYNATVEVVLDSARTVLASSEIRTDDSLLLNDVTFTANDGSVARAFDATSISAHDAKIVTRTVPAPAFDVAASAAWWIVTNRAWPQQRSNGIDVNVAAFKAAGGNMPGLLGLEIGSRIQVINMPDELSPTSTLDLFVEGITDRIGKNGWVRSLMTSPAGNYGRVFALDSATNGVLDNSDVLGF